MEVCTGRKELSARAVKNVSHLFMFNLSLVSLVPLQSVVNTRVDVVFDRRWWVYCYICTCVCLRVCWGVGCVSASSETTTDSAWPSFGAWLHFGVSGMQRRHFAQGKYGDM